MNEHHDHVQNTKGIGRNAASQLLTACDRPWTHPSLLTAAAGLITILLSGTASSQTLTPISYTLSFLAPHTHYVDIKATIPTDERRNVELMMATWTPGSYLIREFSRHVETLEARTRDGRLLPVKKSRKNRWTVDAGRAESIVVSYRVYGREMSVRTNWIDSDFAMLNGAPTFLTLADDARGRPHDVALLLPSNWDRGVTGLKQHPSGKPNTYRADSYDILVDSPIIIGNPAVYEFSVNNTPHQLVNIGEAGIWRGAESADDVKRITDEIYRMWKSMPYDRYLFFNMITEAGGGLEHQNSTLLMSSRWDTSSRDNYLRWLGLVSHELFHAWNGKRLRPIELGSFDYENEVYTESLWMVEGLTSYYADLAVHRAGLSTEDEYLEALSSQIRTLQTTPGRAIQPVTRASYDAWVKYYRRDENSRNSSVSYYSKGAVLGFLLDMQIRASTDGANTLDDLMRLLYSRFSETRGFTTNDIRSAARELAGVDMSMWFTKALNTTEDLDYSQALKWLGLEFFSEIEKAKSGWVGLVTQTINARTLVTEVTRDTPGQKAGFNVDDEILAIGPHRVLHDQWNERIGQTTPGSELAVLISRRGELRQIQVKVGTRPANDWELQSIVDPTPSQQHHREEWLAAK